MFKNLLDLSYDRSPREALGFYLAYLVGFILVFFLVGAIAGIVIVPIMGLDNDAAFQSGLKIGQIISMLVCPALSFMILVKKKVINNFSYVLLAILSAICAIFLGTLLGLIPIAFLTTRKKAV